MAADPWTAFWNGLAAVFQTAKPVIDDALDQKPESGHKARMDQWNVAQTAIDPMRRADLSWVSVVRLLSEGGKTTGGNGTSIKIPSDTLANLYELASEGVRDRAMLNRRKSE